MACLESSSQDTAESTLRTGPHSVGLAAARNRPERRSGGAVEQGRNRERLQPIGLAPQSLAQAGSPYRKPHNRVELEVGRPAKSVPCRAPSV